MSSGSTKIIAGIIVVGIVIGLIVILNKSPPTRKLGVCELQGSEPDVDVKNVPPIKSNANLALTKFAGFIVYEPIQNSTDKSKHQYMSLFSGSQAVDLKIIKATNTVLTKELTLTFDCASFLMGFDVTASGVTTKYFRVDLKLANGNFSKCYIDADIGYHHYRCNEERYKCMAKEKTSSGESTLR